MTDTTTPPAIVLDALPAPCCVEGQTLVTQWVQALAADPYSRESLLLGSPYSAHMINVHRITGRPSADCVNCLEWVAVLELEDGQDPDLGHPLGAEAARHFIRHWVLNPVAAALTAGGAATLPEGDTTP